MERVRILLVKSGEAGREVRDGFGDYDSWFRTTLAEQPIEWSLVRPYRGEPLPARPDVDAVIISGSPLSLTTPEPWMHDAAGWVRGLLERETPLLAVCFGHQLLGWALGARVIRNPLGREVGTRTIRLTEAGLADPLFAEIDAEPTVQTTHEDVLDAPPEGAVVLAGNDNTPLQAFAVGERARAVQFHPELEARGMEAVVRQQRAAIARAAAARGEDEEEAFRRTLDAVSPTPAGPRMLLNFLRSIVGADANRSASLRA